MHFTVDENPEIDAQIASDLARIKEAVRGAVPSQNFVALFLVGGFGRGEGGVVRRTGRFRPANDYDLELITHKPAGSPLLHKLGQSLARELNIPWVHIESHTLSKLRHLKYTMYNYDLKYASHHLDGEASALERIPEMDAGRMPLREAQNLMFTRLWCFIGPFRLEMLKRELAPDESFFLAGQLSKALLAIQDAYLIMSGLYHPSYRQRLKNLEKTNVPTEIMPLCRWATTVKLQPEDADTPDLIDLYFRARGHFLKTLLLLLSTMHKRRISEWRRYERTHFNNLYTLIKRLYFFFVKRSRWYIDYLNYNLGVIYLINALGHGEISPDSLTRAHLFLNRVTGFNKNTPLDWTALQNEALRLRESLWV